MNSPIEIFFSYAHEDEGLMNDVRRQLVVYERNGQIIKWHDRMIPPGGEWKKHIDQRLNSSHIVLLFMSPHFIESRYCYEIEGQIALQRHNDGSAKVIPVILRACAWDQTPFGEIQALPADGKPINQWPDRDQACLNTARGIIAAIDSSVAVSAAKVPNPASLGMAPSKASTRDASAKSEKPKKLIYCKRCGRSAGDQSSCVGSYTHHEFSAGSPLDYCKRCGRSAGTQSQCIGSFTAHDFVNAESSTILCTRCGVSTGRSTSCIGSYTGHDFKEF